MKFKKTAKLTYVFAAVFMFMFGQAYASVTETIAGGYTTDSGGKYDLIKGVFKSLSELPMRFFFSEGFFAEDPYTYNPHVAAA